MSGFAGAVDERSGRRVLVDIRRTFRDRPLIPLVFLLFGLVVALEVLQPGIVNERWTSNIVRAAVPPAILAAAQATGGMKRELARLLKPTLLVVDELGYLPIDKFGADCLFQIVSHRYERGATLLTTNRPYKQWAAIYNNDATLTSALLDRLLHHL